MIKNKKNRKIIVATVILLVLASASAYWVFAGDKDDNTTTGGSTDNINYGPPTEEEQEAGDKQKEQLTEDQNRQEEGQAPVSDESGNKQRVNVVITDAGQYDDIIEVRSFIPDHYQDGTCVITFTKGGQTVTKETPARTDVSTTICLNPLIKRSEFPASGDWQVTVAYESTDARGQSETQTIKIK